VTSSETPKAPMGERSGERERERERERELCPPCLPVPSRRGNLVSVVKVKVKVKVKAG